MSRRSRLSVVTAPAYCGGHEHGAHLGRQPAVVGGGGGVLVAQVGDLVLLFAGDAVLLGHLLGRLAHAEAGRRLGDRRGVGHAGRGAGCPRRPRAARPGSSPSTPRRAPGPSCGCAGSARRTGSRRRPRCPRRRGPAGSPTPRRRWPDWPRRRPDSRSEAGMLAGRPAPSIASRARFGAFGRRDHLAHHDRARSLPGPPRSAPPARGRRPWPGPRP